VQIFSFRSECILHARRGFRYYLAVDDVDFFEFSKPLGKARRANPLDSPFQLVESGWLGKPKCMYDWKSPDFGHLVPLRVDYLALVNYFLIELLHLAQVFLTYLPSVNYQVYIVDRAVRLVCDDS
jgi:hypothetical protein